MAASSRRKKTFLTTIGQKETFFFIFIGETRHTCGEHIQSIGKLTNLSQMMVNRKEWYNGLKRKRLIGWRGVSVHRKSQALVLQKLVNFHEKGSFFRFPTPTLPDEVKHFFSALVERRSAWSQTKTIRVEPVFQVVANLVFIQVRQGLFLTIGENFPHGHTKRPHVTFGWPEPL